jgi:hypothetical protein
MPSTYEPIATNTLGSGASSVTFSSISASYTDLVLIVNISGSTDINVQMQFNGDTGSNYSTTVLGGSGSAAVSDRYSNQSYIQINYQAFLTAAFNTNSIINIQNYSNATTYKTSLSRFNNASNGVDAVVGLWRNTAAITSVLLKTHTGTFATGSTFTLYGIKAA